MATTVGGISIDIDVNTAGVTNGMEVAKSVVKAGADSIQGVLQSMQGYLLALGGGLTVAAFTSMVKGSIEAAAGLHDLSIQTGASVAALAAFRSVASTTPTTMEDIANAMNKASKAMAVANEDSKGIAAAINALGLNFNTLKAMKPEDQMLAVANAMNEFEDGTGKSAAAMAIYGKEGAKMLPFLKDLAEQTHNVTAKLTEQQIEAKRVMAAMADDFSDNLTKIKKDGDAWKKDISMAMLPALWELSEAFRQVMNGPGGLKAEITKLSADGSITTWSRQAIVGLTYVMDAFEGFWVVVKTVALGVGAALAVVATAITTTFNVANQVLHGDFSAAIDSVKSGFRGVGTIGSSVAEDIGVAWGAQTMGAKFRDRLEDVQRVGVAAKVTKEQLKFAASEDGAGIDKEIQAYKSLIKAIGEKSAVTALEGQATEKLSAGQQEAAKITASLANGTLKLTAAHQADVKAALDAWIANEKLNESKKKEEKATLVATEAHWKYLESLEKTLDKTLAEIDAETERTARLGLSKEAIARLESAKLDLMATELERQAIRNLDKNLDEAEYQAIMKQAQAYRDLGKAKLSGARAEIAKKEADDAGKWWSKTSEDIERSLTDALQNGFDKGKDFWDSMRDYIVNGAKSLAIKILVQPVMGVINSIGQSIFGGGQDSGGSSGVSGISSLSSIAKLFGNGPGSFTGMLGNGITAVADLFGSNAASAFGMGMANPTIMQPAITAYTEAAAAAMAEGNTALAGTYTTTASSLGAGAGASSMIPIIGWIIAGIMASGNAYDMGFRGNSDAHGATNPLNWGLNAEDRLIGKPLGLDDKTSAMLSGSALGAWASYAVFGGHTITPAGGALVGTFGSSGSNLQSRTDYTQDHRGFLGMGSYTTHNSEYSAASAETTRAYDEALQSITQSTAAYATALGLNAHAMDGFSEQVEINTTGMDEKAAKAAVAAALIKFSNDQVTAAYTDALTPFQHAGEELIDTLHRLVSMQAAAAALNEFGGVFSKIASAGVGATESMITLAGSLEKLMAKSAQFVKDYYSSDEQNGLQAKSVLDQLNAAGVHDAQLLTNKDEFRALVEAIDVSTEAGRKQLNALLDIAPQFAALVDIIQSQHSDLGALASLAPDTATLNPLFAATDTTGSSSADNTIASINTTTDAINAGTSAVVKAIETLSNTVATAVNNGTSTTSTALNNMAAQLDAINNTNRLELAGG